MIIEWEIGKSNRLKCEGFPFLDGCIGNIRYDYYDKCLEIDILRENPNQTCSFKFFGVKKYAFEVWGDDIASAFRISKIGNLANDGSWQEGEDSPWNLLYGNYGEEEILNTSKRMMGANPHLYIAELNGNMDGRIALIFEALELNIY